MTTLNLGVLAHVDAGKTTLTERLLHTAGVIDTLGSVDQGTTQTDSLALERARGITIRAAVASFVLRDVTVNLLDTPGHPDFIAEVDRLLGLLDGAVLVVSAVEGVQAQTVVLMRALRRLHVPTVIFVNKVDRAGADPDRVLLAVRRRLGRDVVAVNRVVGAGAPDVCVTPFAAEDPRFLDALTEVLADHDDALLAAAVDEQQGWRAPDLLSAKLAEQTAASQLNPLVYGSAATGAGVADLVTAVTTLLPATRRNAAGPVVGTVFKVERSPRGEQLAYADLRSGTLRMRQRLAFGAGSLATVTGVQVFESGRRVSRPEASAGQIALLSGLRGVRVGDSIGELEGRGAGTRTRASFSPPALETAVVARDPGQQPLLHAALLQLAEQDPLIDVRQDDRRRELYLSLYGEVQKEVVEQTLADDFGVAVSFSPTTPICVERLAGTGRAVVRLGEEGNPFVATVGLELHPAPVGAGITLRVAAELTTIPLYVYNSVDAFTAAMTGYLRSTLREGLRGWAVPDCSVVLTESGYISPSSTAGDFRKLTPEVARTALARAGTQVCEPVHRFTLDAPADTLPAVLRLLAAHRAVPGPPRLSEDWLEVQGQLPVAEIAAVRQALPSRTRGEGVLETVADSYQPVRGAAPVRVRSDGRPLPGDDRRGPLLQDS